MTRPVNPLKNDVPDSAVSELHALYHEGSMDEPSPLLDRAILEAARAELRTDRVAKRPVPWWKSWLVPATSIAVGILGLSLSWRIVDQQELDLRKEMSAVESSAPGERTEESIGQIAPAKPTATPQPSVSAQAPSAKSRDVEQKAARTVYSPSSAPSPAPAQAAKKSLAPAPQPLLERQAEAKNDAGALGSSLAAPQVKLEAKRSRADSSSVTATEESSGAIAKLADDAATPEIWLKNISELRAAGRYQEAAQSLARFRERYPDQLLPDDLSRLK